MSRKRYRAKVTINDYMKSHIMRLSFRLTSRSMILDDLEFDLEFIRISQSSDATTAKRVKIDQWAYCERQRCKHVELEQFLACFRVARVCQRQLCFLVMLYKTQTTLVL